MFNFKHSSSVCKHKNTPRLPKRKKVVTVFIDFNYNAFVTNYEPIYKLN